MNVEFDTKSFLELMRTRVIIAFCVNCDRTSEIDTHGRCVNCQSNSIIYRLKEFPNDKLASI